MKKLYFVLIIFLVLFSCNDDYKTPEEINTISMDVKVKRFDQDFSNVNRSDFSKLKEKYPYMSDANWENDKKDTLVVEMLEEVNKVFPDFNEEKEDLDLLFKHIKFYFPEFNKPTLITVTSGVDYRNKVLLKDSILALSLDTYLGENHKYYADLYKYVAKNLKKENIVTDVSELYAKQFVKPGKLRKFIDQIVYFGKILYLQDKFSAFKSEELRIGYTKEELEWAQENEGQIWSYFIENDLLFSTKSDLMGRFIAPAPFSKFYLELDNQSPGMLGRYIGWQIVRSFMEKNNVSLRDLCLMSGEEIFNKSKYKPAR